MSSWRIVRPLLRGAEYTPLVRISNDAEYFPDKSETAAERAALEGSAKQWNESIPPVSMRVATIIQAPHLGLAVSLADRKLTTAVDLLRIGLYGFLRYRLMRAGYVRNLESGEVSSIGYEDPPLAGGMFSMPFAYEPLPLGERIRRFEHTDLAARTVRSAHWHRRAQEDPDMLFRVVSRWFALESAWQEKEGDIGGWVRWALGVPPKKSLNQIPKPWRTVLEGNPRWTYWSHHLPDVVDEIRILRNSVAHSGSRPVDVPIAKLVFFDGLTEQALGRTEAMLLAALGSGETEVAGLVKRVGDLFVGSFGTAEEVLSHAVAGLDRAKADATAAGGATPF